MFEWTDGNNQRHFSTRFKDVEYVFLDGSVGKRIRIPPNFKIDPAYRYSNLVDEFSVIIDYYEELLIETTDSDTFGQFLLLLENTVHVKRLTFKGVTFQSHPDRHGDSSTRLPHCEFLKFVKCTFERDTFTPREWKTATHLIFKNTTVSDMQEDSKNFSFENVELEGTNEYLTDEFQIGFHFPKIKQLEMKNVGEFLVPLTSDNITYVQRWTLKGDIRPIINERGFDSAGLHEHFRKFVFKPDDPTDDTDAFAHIVLSNVIDRVDKVSVKCKKCGQFVSLRGRSRLDGVMFEILMADGNPYGKPARKTRRELKQLVGEEGGHHTVLTEDPRGAPIRYARGVDALDEALFEADFQSHLTDPRNVADYHTLRTSPSIFENTVRYMHGLSEEKKKAIFYYTSGKDSRTINEFLLDKIPEADMHAIQLRAMNTLIKDIYPNIPPVSEPFVVFRGYPMNKLDDGAFHSSTIRVDLFKVDTDDDWYTKFDQRSLVARPVESEAMTSCCIHVIRVMPGARVLYFQDTWAGISAYGEFEVLFAPYMGTFHHLRSTKEKVDSTKHIIYHHWVYVPTGVPVVNKRTLEERFNRMKVHVNAPHPAMSLVGAGTFIRVPSTPTGRATYADRTAVATFVPGQTGLPFTSTKLTSAKLKLLMKMSKDVSDFDDGEAAGTIIFEPDGRLWIVHPTNKFMGYTSTFPKGTRDHNEDLRKTAIRETYEETGLLVSLIPYPGICYGEGINNGAFVKLVRASGVTYYYLAKRESGSPSDMGWESQAVSLVPVTELRAQHIGERYVSLANWDEARMADGPTLQPGDYLSQDSKIVDHIVDQVDVIQGLLEA